MFLLVSEVGVKAFVSGSGEGERLDAGVDLLLVLPADLHFFNYGALCGAASGGRL